MFEGQMLYPRQDDFEVTATIQEIIDAISVSDLIAIVLLVFTIISVILRFYVRLGINKVFGPEDWAMLVTFALAMVQAGTGLESSANATAFFTGKADASAFTKVNRFGKISGFFYVSTLIGTKLSLGFFFLNIFSHKKTERIIIYSLMAASTLFGIIYMPLGYGSCAVLKEVPGGLPGADKGCPRATQTAANAFLGIFSIVNIIGDFVLPGLAMRALLVARLPLATKVSASVLLVVGSGGGVATAARLAMVYKETSLARYSQEAFLLTSLVQIELATGIIVANMAMTRPLFHKLMHVMGFISHTDESRTGGASTTARSGVRKTTKSQPGDELLLEEIKREVAVTVVVDTPNEKGPISASRETHHGRVSPSSSGSVRSNV